MKYRKKPVVIEAIRLPLSSDDNLEDFHAWCRLVGFENFTSERDETLSIETLEGTMLANPGDWIIRGVAGEFYPCQDSIFKATYDAVE